MIRGFFKAVWRGITIVRLALANLVFIAFLVILWVAFSGSESKTLPDRAALLLDLDGVVVDQRSQVDAAALLLEGQAASGEILLTDLIDSVDAAAKDARIVALVLDVGGLIGMSQSKVLELAPAIERFRQAGKPVVATGDYFSQDQYRLAVEADTVLMHPLGGVAVEGFGYYINFFAEALEKLSVSMHVFRAGEFKSIAEPWLRSDMSPGEKAVSEEWLSDLWDLYTDAVETRRGLPAGSLTALLNDYPAQLEAAGGSPAELALQRGLVDDLLGRRQQAAYLTALVGAEGEDGEYASIQFAEYLPVARQRSATAAQRNIAVVTAQGNMLPGEQPPGTIGADSLVRTLRRAASMEGLSAIVLRVNSPGGSVFAAEVIREELEAIREKGTPVFVSMGTYAASGGYYIATAADSITATPATVTGSIGVFLAFPTFENLLAKGGIYTDGVGTTSLAGSVRFDRPLSPALSRSLQLGVDQTYERFLGHVMQSRKLERNVLDALAEGRVLSAEDALAGGLVDTLGSLDDTVRAAAEFAGLEDGDYEVRMMGPALSPRQQFLQQISEGFGAQVSAAFDVPLLREWFSPLRQGVNAITGLQDPQNLYVRCLECEALAPLRR